MEPTYRHPYRPDGWQREIYPMPAFPMLTVTNVERSARWYQDALGFADVFTMRGHDGAPLLAHLRWCAFGDVLLTAARTPVDGPRGRGITLNFSAESADEVAERARAAGAEVVDGPADRPWNARDVTILDPDGYRLNFTAPQAAALERMRQGTMESFDALVARLRGRPAGESEGDAARAPSD